MIETLPELGVTADFSGRNDITIDGKKICGNALRLPRRTRMHHGPVRCSILILPYSSRALEISKEVVEAKGVKSVRSRVNNILPNLPEKITVQQFADRILAHMKQHYPEMVEDT